MFSSVSRSRRICVSSDRREQRQRLELNGRNRGLTIAYVTLADIQSATRTTRTISFGYFRFDDVGAGQSYIVSINSKRYQFAPQVINVIEEITDLSFVGAVGKPNQPPAREQ